MEKIAGGKNGRTIKRKIFCVKYPAEHDFKLKAVQGAEPPDRGLGTDGPERGGGGGGGGQPLEW